MDAFQFVFSGTSKRDVNVYFKKGTWDGYTDDLSHWTEVFRTSFESTQNGAYTEPYALDPGVVCPANSTCALFILATSISGLFSGAITSDGTLTIKSGIAVDNIGDDNPTSPWIWYMIVFRMNC